jgi:hypothetical protein
MFRAVLICLLILALPTQGALAATMAFCGQHHHGRAADAGTSHHADAAHAHAHHAGADGHVEAAAADQTAAPDKFAKSGLQKCSVCASCCSAAAIHDTVPKLPVLEPVVADFVFLVPAVEPFAADGPERPPRRLFA